MKIARIDCLAADGGWRIFDFVKVTLSDGRVGWSEFSRAFIGPGVAESVAEIGARLIGEDPRSTRVGATLLEAGRRSTVAHQACGALYNALLDVRARALGVPAYALLGTLLRDRVPLYWAHCGTYRVSHAALMQRPPLRSLADVVGLGREVAARGYPALKTNLLLFEADRAVRYAPRRRDGAPPLTSTPALERAIAAQLAALREGTGADTQIMVNLGANFRTAGALQMARAMEPLFPAWLEIELRDPAALRYVRERCSIPIASGETLRLPESLELLRVGALDVLIVDVLFNGVAESLHIAAAAQAYETNVAVHNCYSPLATLIAAAYCAVTPNLQVLEHDVDGVPWATDLVTVPPTIAEGVLNLPTTPGWGTEVNESAVAAHPLPTASGVR